MNIIWRLNINLAKESEQIEFDKAPQHHLAKELEQIEFDKASQHHFHQRIGAN